MTHGLVGKGFKDFVITVCKQALVLNASFVAFLRVFTEFWCVLVPSTKIFGGQYKSLLHFLGGREGGVRTSPRTACYCQKS